MCIKSVLFLLFSICMSSKVLIILIILYTILTLSITPLLILYPIPAPFTPFAIPASYTRSIHPTVPLLYPTPAPSIPLCLSCILHPLHPSHCASPVSYTRPIHPTVPLLDPTPAPSILLCLSCILHPLHPSHCASPVSYTRSIHPTVPLLDPTPAPSTPLCLSWILHPLHPSHCASPVSYTRSIHPIVPLLYPTSAPSIPLCLSCIYICSFHIPPRVLYPTPAASISHVLVLYPISAASIPSLPVLSQVNINGCTKVSDGGLAVLINCPSVGSIDAMATMVTHLSGAAKTKGCPLLANNTGEVNCEVNLNYFFVALDQIFRSFNMAMSFGMFAIRLVN